MPVTTTKEAGRASVMHGDDPRLTENASAKLARKQAEAKRAADALNTGRYQRDMPPISAESAEHDNAPLFDRIGKVPLESLLEQHTPVAHPKVEKSARKIALQTTVEHRGRRFTIVAEGMTLDQLCDLLDERGYAAADTATPAAPLATPDDLPDGYKLCRKHGAPMRPRNKQGEWWHSHNVGTAENPCWCKGYKGSDSPGYDR